MTTIIFVEHYDYYKMHKKFTGFTLGFRATWVKTTTTKKISSCSRPCFIYLFQTCVAKKNLACCKAIMENDNKVISSNRRSPVMETSAMVEFGQTTLCRGSSGVLQLAELSTGKKRDLFRHPALFLSRMLASRAIHIEVSNSLDTDSFIHALRRSIARRGPI